MDATIKSLIDTGALGLVIIVLLYLEAKLWKALREDSKERTEIIKENTAAMLQYAEAMKDLKEMFCKVLKNEHDY